MTLVRFISVGFDQLNIRVVNPRHGLPRRSKVERFLYFDLQETVGKKAKRQPDTSELFC